MRRSIAFVVLGRAQPAGSKRAFPHASTGRVVVVDDAKGSRPWKQEVAGAALAALGDCPRPPFVGPLALYVSIYVARPKSHYGTGRNAAVLRPTAPAWPATKPDTTKLVRALEDALTSVLWRDDAQVVQQFAEKRFGSPERCELLVRSVPQLAPALVDAALIGDVFEDRADAPLTAVATTATA